MAHSFRCSENPEQNTDYHFKSNNLTIYIIQYNFHQNVYKDCIDRIFVSFLHFFYGKGMQ